MNPPSPETPVKKRLPTPFLAIVFAHICCILALPCAAQEAGTPWSPRLVRDAQRWGCSKDDPSIAVVEKGLKVVVPPGRTWRIAAAGGIRLPRHAGRVRLNVAELGGDARWLIRLYGNLPATGLPRTVGLFQDETRKGTVTLAIDPRLVSREHGPPLQIQLGLEGGPGDYVVFDSLEFLPDENRPNRATGKPQPGQRNIECVTLMPNIPRPFKMLDWRRLARDYDEFVFDFDAKGQYLPLVWIDDSRVNIDRPVFGLPSYVGDPRRTNGPHHESITCMGAVLGATLAGIDKRRQRHDYVLMCEAYYNAANGERLVLNGVNARSGGSFWY